MSHIFVRYENIFRNHESCIYLQLQSFLHSKFSKFSAPSPIFSAFQCTEWVSKQKLIKEEFLKVIGPLNTHPRTVEEANKPSELFKILPQKKSKQQSTSIKVPTRYSCLVSSSSKSAKYNSELNCIFCFTVDIFWFFNKLHITGTTLYFSST